MPQSAWPEKIAKWIDLPIILGFTTLVAYHWKWNPRYLIGMMMAAIGFGLWGLARFQIRKSFSASAQAKGLITTGLYSRIRNPVYVFGGLGYAGLWLAYAPAFLIFFIPFYSWFQAVRVKKESAVLENAFGDEYRRYKAQTWF